jgi:tetratricopeptide (TPR) repeat protein
MVREEAVLVRSLFILLLLAAAPALAQSNDDAEQCLHLGKAEADAGSDRRIEVCTRAIESGSLSQEKLAVALNSRGAAYARRNDPDRAIADFDAALRLYPDFLAASSTAAWPTARRATTSAPSPISAR